ncbi:hypothetical protein [Gelidibacter japonicus]|uniref:hypothetical protein n=1 Tax=Gelidibacter japonicus TaxID=1962232 RepID=UPI003A8F246A
MGLLDINFNFGNSKKEAIHDLDSKNLEKVKFDAKVAIIDDEEVPHMESLTNDGYNVHHFTDIVNIEEFIKKGHDVLILDIQGVGKKIAGQKEGWGVLEYLKTNHPHLVIIIFTGADWNITEYNDVAKLADFIAGKDSEYLSFKMKLDAAIKKSLSIEYHLNILKAELKKEGVSSIEIEKIIRKHGRNSSKAFSKINKITNNKTVLESIDNVLSIISSIYSLIP